MKAIKDSCTTLETVNRKLGNGSGDCRGERCQGKIGEIVEALARP